MIRTTSFVLFVLALVSVARAQSITLNSGIDANSDGLDDSASYLLGPQNSGFASPFTTADFAAAQSGPYAVVLTQLDGSWDTGNGATSPLANWISTALQPPNDT